MNDESKHYLIADRHVIVIDGILYVEAEPFNADKQAFLRRMQRKPTEMIMENKEELRRNKRGRRSKILDETKQKCLEMVESGLKRKDVAEELGISLSAVNYIMLKKPKTKTLQEMITPDNAGPVKIEPYEDNEDIE